MTEFDPHAPPTAWGANEDAEALCRWPFRRRTPEQRLAWLVAALEIAYHTGALVPKRPADMAGPAASNDRP